MCAVRLSSIGHAAIATTVITLCFVSSVAAKEKRAGPTDRTSGILVQSITEHPAWLTYTGVATLALGAVTAGLGAIPGYKAKNAYNKIDPGGPNSTDQIKTERLKNTGDTNVDRANLLYIIGGTLVVVGGALVAIDRLILADLELSVSVSTDGVNGSLSFSY